MKNFKITLEYDGTDFNGWQLQVSTRRTVQGEIEKALEQIFKKKISLHGSGRTDSGVHALAQTAHFKVKETRLTPTEITKALNGNLPSDIAVLATEEKPETFHSRFSVKRKTYRYTIMNRPGRCAIERRFSLHVPQKLNLAAMRRESVFFIGRKDFRSFTAADRHAARGKNTVRTVYLLDLKRRGGCILIEIEASGFLYKMVRNIVGTLIAVGAGSLPEGASRSILKKRNRVHAPQTAPAHGLCLVRVSY